jgi:uncharacterized protein (TIGR00297 family)
LNLTQIFLGMLLAVLAAYAAYRLKALDRSGALAAFLLGALVFGLGGLPWAVVLLTFFITSSGLSRLFKQRKKKTEEKFSKGGTLRDAGQVAANGGVAGLTVLLGVILPASPYPWVMFAAALAAANADTWATELGVLSRAWPRSMSTWQRVAPGTSGGISLVGTLAAFTGSLLIAMVAFLFWPGEELTVGTRFLYAFFILIAGFTGSLVDSLLGATLHGIFWCPVCEKETERSPRHTCGGPTTLIRGRRWLNNDVVNLFCTVSSVLMAFLLSQFIA